MGLLDTVYLHSAKKLEESRLPNLHKIAQIYNI